jgi:uncharacterized protein (UPF0261 family)
MSNAILIIATLDTKGEETFYLRDKIIQLGLTPLVMDIAMRGGEGSVADIPPAEVAAAGGSSLEEISRSTERAEITAITTKGARHLARKLHASGRIGAVIALGGSTGTLMATDVMRALPFGVPKVMISSTAALPGLATRYIGTADIALFHSVIEISGLSDLMKNVINRAARAVAGMLDEVLDPSDASNGKAIALTMLGPCEQCASQVRTALTEAGYQVIGFSAAGIGDRAMEEMITLGFFQGVIDLAPGGVGEHLFGFMRDAGPTRMEAAGRAGIPQIISTCSVNHMTPAKSKYKPDYHERRMYHLDKFRTWLRMETDELQQVADAFADKLNRAQGQVAVAIPMRGWSSVDSPGNPTYAPQEDRIFVERLRELVRPDIQILETDANMEDPTFADAITALAKEIF